MTVISQPKIKCNCLAKGVKSKSGYPKTSVALYKNLAGIPVDCKTSPCQLHHYAQ